MTILPRILSALAAITLLSGVSFTASGQTDSLELSAPRLADRIIEEAVKYLGVPYKSGGKAPYSFDCSGFTSYVYGRCGIKISPSVVVQATQGREVTGNICDLQKGDLVLFGARNDVSQIGHVGIYIGPDNTEDGFTFIHAAVHGGIQVSNVRERYYAERFLGVRRVLPDFYADSVGTMAPVDSLKAGGDSLGIMLLKDGRWAYILPDGSLAAPGADTKYVLEPSGKWTSVNVSPHAVPLLKDAAARKAEKPKTSAPSTSTSGSAQYHTVKSGDTLYKIAGHYHTSVRAICNLNGIKESTVLQIGKKLRVK